MGEMIKFGIKLAMTIACALALMAAIFILFDLITSTVAGLSSSSPVISAFRDIATVVSICLPFNVVTFGTIIASVMSYKVAYWASDKMIQFINALG